MTTRTLLSTLAACWALLALACADGSGQGALATDEPRPP